MAPDTVSPTSEERELALKWSNRVSLTPRILAVNIFALALLGGGFSYLDSYRSRIVDSRVAQASRETKLIAQAIASAGTSEKTKDTRALLVLSLARDTGTRIRLYDQQGKLLADSRELGLRNNLLRDPDKDPTGQTIARFLDAVIDTVAGADRAPLYRDHLGDHGLDWPDVRTAQETHGAPATVWRAPDRTPVITAAAPIAQLGVVMTMVNARDITQTVRAERYRLGVVLLVVSVASILISLFLARTIVRPLRLLARAAQRVRLGRAREVVVPRLPSRMDEIGLLARALSDMSQALRARIDATEAFAADVTHELKNPLASLRSAVEGLTSVKKKEHRDQLLEIVRDDVHRLDRLITDISEASRLDAQLSRAKFEPVDVGMMIEALIEQRETRGLPNEIRLVFDRAPGARLRVLGEGARLERVFENLIENAISFSPTGSLISIGASSDSHTLTIQVEDEGPGIPEEAREAVFRRFHSVRPESEAFGQHSGLGLAIARTIVEAHQGSIAVESREDRLGGARFVVRLPLSEGHVMAELRVPELSFETIHASCVAIDGRAVLIEGRSGEGKSDLALRLIDRGAVLISDDQTTCQRQRGGLIASPPTTIAGRIEVRGLGILELPYVEKVPVDLLIVILDAPPRFPEDRRTRRVAGIDVPVLALAALEPSAPIKVELALKQLHK